MLQRAPLAAINHLLAAAPWARQRLAPFAGKVVAIEVAPLMLQLQVAADGLVCAPQSDREPNVRIEVPTGALPLAVQGVDALFRKARISGEAEFAEAIGFVARNLRWDAEEDLSRLIGDIAAHRAVGAAQAFIAWQKQALGRTAENLGEYFTEENPMLLRPEAMKPFIDEVDSLRDAIARLEKRVEKASR